MNQMFDDPVPALVITQRFEKFPDYTQKIVADGKTDDTLGFIAAFRNEPVIFDGKRYEKDETLYIRDRSVFMSMSLYLFAPDEVITPEHMQFSKIVIMLPKILRYVDMENCPFVQKFITLSLQCASILFPSPETMKASQ